MTRYGSVIKVREEMIDRYKYLHANPWPEINAMITACNIRNYSIYMRDGYLYSYFEYVGDDFDGDMAKMAADPKTQEWWMSVSLVKNHCLQLQKASGGHQWKRFTIWINV